MIEPVDAGQRRWFEQLAVEEAAMYKLKTIFRTVLRPALLIAAIGGALTGCVPYYGGGYYEEAPVQRYEVYQPYYAPTYYSAPRYYGGYRPAPRYWGGGGGGYGGHGGGWRH